MPVLIRAVLMFFLQKMALKLALDMVQEALDKGAAKTEANWDDQFAKSFRENRDDLEKVIRGAL